MKRTILTILTLSPFFAFGQAYAESSNSVFGNVTIFLIGLGISIAIFFILRQLFLWYWKVEVIIKKQDEQINLLRGIYNSLEQNNKLTQSQIDLTIGKDNQNKI